MLVSMMLRRCLALLLAGTSLAISIQLPYGALWVSLTSLMVLATSVRWPLLAFAWIGAAIPALDLTPWTGRFFVNEFDAWVVAAIAGALWATPLRLRWSPSWIDVVIWILVAASYALGVWITFSDTAPFPEGYWNPYDNPFNALRIAKPVAYAAGTLLLLTSLRSPPRWAATAFAAGTAFGIAETFGAVALERQRFCGLLATEVDFRPTGPFADMHVGGAYLDAYLVAAAPLLLLILRRRQSLGIRVGCLILGAAAAYGVFATLSRAPVLAAAIQCIFLALAWSVGWIGRRNIGWGAPLGFLLVASVGGFAVSESPAFRSRFAASVGDWNVRTAHWKAAVDAVSDTPQRRLFGIGVGRYPFLGRSWVTGNAAKNYQFRRDNNRSYVRLAGNDPLYLGQYVDVSPGKVYTIQVTGRGVGSEGAVSVGLFEKNLLQAVTGHAQQIGFSPASSGQWTTEVFELDSKGLGGRIGGLRVPMLAIPRPVVLSFWPLGTSVVDICSIELEDENGRCLVVNPDFEDGQDRWWWTGDVHASWHALNIAVHYLVEQGVFGLATMTVLAIRIGYRTCVAILAGDTDAIAIGASVLGLLTVGVFDSVVDSPRICLLFFVLCIFAMAMSANPTRGALDDVATP